MTAFGLRSSDWSSDVCSSDRLWLRRGDHRGRRLVGRRQGGRDGRDARGAPRGRRDGRGNQGRHPRRHVGPRRARHAVDRTLSGLRSEEHTSELQSLMRISYAVFCLKKKTTIITVKNAYTLLPLTSAPGLNNIRHTTETHEPTNS